MCTGRCQFRKPGAVERNQQAENIGGQAPVIFRTSVSPYAQQRPTWHHGHQTAEMEGGFCFESTAAPSIYSGLVAVAVGWFMGVVPCAGGPCMRFGPQPALARALRCCLWGLFTYRPGLQCQQHCNSSKSRRHRMFHPSTPSAK